MNRPSEGDEVPATHMASPAGPPPAPVPPPGDVRSPDTPVTAVAVGRDDSFERFYRAHRDVVARTLALTLADPALGYEAADEAMARAYERWATVRDYANPEGWVYRTGLNWARSWLRRRARGEAKDFLVATDERTDAAPPDTDLARALAGLTDDHRAVVVLRFFRDWSVEQTAEALGVAPGTVKSRLSRALEQLHVTIGTEAAP